MSKQIYTSLSRTRYRELIAAIETGELEQKWVEGKEPVTKAEQTEERQIRALAMIYAEGKELRDNLATLNWTSLCVYTDGTLIVKGLR